MVADDTSSPRLDLSRPPLLSSERLNASPRRPRVKEIPSSSRSSSTSRRFPSPLASPRPLPTPQRRSPSPVPFRPSAQRPDHRTAAFSTTTRSLAVSFQEESFFYQTSRARAASPKPSPERRRASDVSSRNGNQLEYGRPSEHRRLWPTAKTRTPSSVARGLVYMLEEKSDSIFATTHMLQQSAVVGDGIRRHSIDVADLDLLASSETDSGSSGSNSGAICSVPELGMWRTVAALPRAGLVSNSFVGSVASSPRSKFLSHRGAVKPSSPCKPMVSPSRGIASPLRVRSGSAVSTSPGVQPANAPSIISFAVEVRRAKKGEYRIEEAHMLRLLDSQHLQWRWVNARATAALLAQAVAAEKNLYNRWKSAKDLRDSVANRRVKLQLLTQNLKLISVLKGQISYLEEWSLTEKDHLRSLSGAVEALKASTLRLPVVGGAKADIRDVKEAVCAAVDAMHAMASSMCHLLSKVDGKSTLVCEIAKVATQEHILLKQSRDLLSKVAAMHVKHWSLQGSMLQVEGKRLRQVQM